MQVAILCEVEAKDKAGGWLGDGGVSGWISRVKVKGVELDDIGVRREEGQRGDLT